MKRLAATVLLSLAVFFGNDGLSSAADRLPYWAGFEGKSGFTLTIGFSNDGKNYSAEAGNNLKPRFSTYCGEGSPCV